MDDAYIGASGKGLRGRGTDQAPYIVAAERARGGRCAIRAVSDCSGASYREFGTWHIARSSHVRADGWKGTAGGLKEWPGLDQRPFDAADDDARLPLAHHLISNFQAHVIGTYHGVTPAYLQSYMDEFCWRYNHRGMKGKLELLLRDMCSHAKRARGELLALFAPQPFMMAAT